MEILKLFLLSLFCILSAHGNWGKPLRNYNVPVAQIDPVNQERQLIDGTVGNLRPFSVRTKDILNFIGGSLMYINLLLGNQNGFKNLTSQIQNISSDLKLTREEVFGRFDNLNTSLVHFFPDIFNHSDSDLNANDIQLVDSLLDVVINEISQTNEVEEVLPETGDEPFSEDRNENLDYVNEILQTALERRRTRKRLKRDAEPEQIQGKVRDRLEKVVETTLRQRTHNDAQTVGTMLATIPAILEDHGISFESISNGFNSFESTIENIAKQMHEDNEKMHEDNKQMHEDSISQTKQIINQMHDDSMNIQNKLSSGFDGIQNELHDQLEPIALNLGDESNLDDIVHEGLHQIAEKLGDEDKLEDTLHKGLDIIAANLGDKSNLEDAVHDGLHGISEKLGQIQNSNALLADQFINKFTTGLDDNKLVADKFINKLTSGFDGLQKEMHHQLEPIALNLGDESNIDDIVHEGLHQIAEKLGDNHKLEDTIHNGFDTIAENLGGKSNLEDAVHDGLHGISEKLDQITNYGLDGIIDTLKSRNPVVNLPSSFGNSLGQAIGQSVGQNLFEDLTDHLKSMTDGIEDHGALIAGTITNQNIIDEGEEANQLQTFDQIITALQGMTSAISSGQSDITNAVSSGLDNTKKAIEISGENGKVGLDVLNAALVSTLSGGYQQVSDALGNGNAKLADSIHDSNDALETIATNIAKAGTENKEALSLVGSKIENGNTMISTSIDTAADFIDHVKDEIKTSGEMLESGLDNIEDKLALLETLGVNVKNLDTHLKDSLKTVSTIIQGHSEDLVTSLSDLKDELQIVGGNIQNGKESLDEIGETLKLLDSLSKFMESNVDNLKSLDANTVLGLGTISETLVDASTKNKEGFESLAALLLGTTEEGPANIVDSLLTLASNVKNSGMESKDELAKIVENIATVGTGIESVAMKTEESGEKNKDSLDGLTAGLASLSTIVDTASNYLKNNGEGSDDSMDAIKQVLQAMNAEILASNNRLVAGIKEGHDKIADNIEDGSDNIADKVSNSVLTGNDKIKDSIDAGNTKLAESFTAGNTKVADSITAGQTRVADSNDNIADMIEAGNTKLSESITAGNTKIADSITAGQTKVSDSITAGQTKVADSIEAGQNLVASSITAGQTKVSDSITAGNSLISNSINTGNTKISDSINIGNTKISDSVLAGNTKISDTNSDIANAIIAGDGKIETALINTKGTLDQLKGAVDVQNEKIQNGLDDLASNVKEAGVSNKDALSDVSLNIKENADNIKQAGVDNKDGLTNLGTHTETAATNIDKLATNVETAATNIQQAGADNKISLEAVATAVTTGEDKVAEALNIKVTDALTAGDNKIEAVLQDAKTSLDNIKGAVDVQNERILKGLTSLATNVKQAGDDNQAGLTVIGNNMGTAADNLDTLATNVKDAGLSNNDALAEVSLKIKENADNVKQAGADNKVGLTNLGTHTETAATNIATLATNVAQAGTDNKDSLDDISARIETAAGHLEKSATNSEAMVSTFNQFATDSKSNLEGLKSSIDTLEAHNKEGLDNVAQAIKDFTSTASSDTSKVETAVNELKTSLELKSTELKTEIKEELDNIEKAIISAQGRTAQLAAIKRLADKIECTEDCFVSSDQADAIIRGLDSNDQNLNTLIGDLNAVASNVPTTSARIKKLAVSQKKKKRSQNSKDDPEKRVVSSPDEVEKSLLDTIIALQNPDFNLTKIMTRKGHSFQEFVDILSNLESLKMNSSIDSSSLQSLENFLHDAGIPVTGSEDVDILQRKGRSFINAGNSVSSLIKIDDFIKGIEFFRPRNNSDFLDKTLLIEQNGTEKSLNPSKHIAPRRIDTSKILSLLAGDVLFNPATAYAVAELAREALQKLYNNEDEDGEWQEARPQGFLTHKDEIDDTIKMDELTLDNFLDNYVLRSKGKNGNDFADLGLGKETKFYYPWHPKGSPTLCKEAQTAFGESDGPFWKPDIENPKTGTPEEACNEFIFTRQLFKEVSKHVSNIISFQIEESRPEICETSLTCSDPTKPICNQDNYNCVKCKSTEECIEIDPAKPNCNQDTGECSADMLLRTTQCVTHQECADADPAKPICSVQGCKEKCQTNQKCADEDPKKPICSDQGSCEKCTAHNQCVDPKKLRCDKSTGECQKGDFLQEFFLRSLAETEISRRMGNTEAGIQNTQTNGASVAQIYGDTRRDYIELLNANTLSLDGMAALNNANNDALRSALRDEAWQRHAHVQWIMERSLEIGNTLTESLREIVVRRIEQSYRESEKALNILFEREKRLLKEQRAEIIALQNRMTIRYINLNDYIMLEDEKTATDIKNDFDSYITDIDTEMRKIRDKSKVDGEHYKAIRNMCPGFDINQEYDEISENFDLNKASEMVKKSIKCKDELIKIMRENRNEYMKIHTEAEENEKTIKERWKNMLGINIPRQASTTDDRWTYKDNIFDILIRNNEDLITAIVGKFPATSSDNLLSGIKTSSDNLKSALDSIKGALDGFTRKLTQKFSKISSWAGSVQSFATGVLTHVHPCVAATGCSTTPPIGLPAVQPLVLTRSIVWQNGTAEEYNKTVDWLNATMSDVDLTDTEIVAKDFILSNPKILSDVLGPVVEKLFLNSNLSAETEEMEETNLVDEKDKELSEQNKEILFDDNRADVHLFKMKDELKNEVIHDEKNETEVKEERKLSRKFSGIAGILERKMEEGKRQSEQDTMREKKKESALLFGLI